MVELIALVLVVAVVVALANAAKAKPKISIEQVRELPQANIPVYEISVTTSCSGPDERALSEPLTFVASDEAARVGAWSLPRPLFYIASRSALEYPEAALIESSLPVGRSSAHAEELGYWPTFRGMSAAQRCLFFEWLATHRSDPAVPIGYVFVFFYGLERRLLVDRKDAELIVPELNRLLSIYDNNSFQYYARGLLGFLALRHQARLPHDALQQIVFPDGPRLRLTEMEQLLVLGWHHVHETPLTWHHAAAAASCDPRSKNSVVVKRTRDQFLELFRTRYAERFGEGMRVKVAKRPKRVEYHPGNPTLRYFSEQHLTLSVLNPLGLSSQFKPLVAIWNDCIESLKGYSRAIGKAGSDELSTAAWEKLPPELREQSDHPEADAWEQVVAKNLREDGVAHLSAGTLAEIRGIEARDRLTIKQCRDLCSTAQDLELGVEPDPRITGSAWRWQERVAIFRDAAVGAHLAADSRYSQSSLMLRLGMHIAAADGNVDPNEVEVVTNFLEGTFSMDDAERHRLDVLAGLLTETGSSLRGLARRIEKRLTIKQARAVGKLLVSVAAADGVIHKSEVSALRKTFKSLGLERELLDQILADAKPSESAHGPPVSVTASEPDSRGEAILPRSGTSPAPQAGDVQLDQAVLRRIMQETRDVAHMLHEILDEGNAQEPAHPVVRAVASMTIGELDPVHRAFYDKIVTKEVWSKEDMEALARSHRLMASGAIQAVNDWALHRWDDVLVHGDDPYEVDCSIISAGGQ